MKHLGLHNKPKAAVHLELLPTGLLEEEEMKILFAFSSV
jgi:hypothetical protein